MARNLVAVTGGAGFIGSELVRQLVDEGQRVLVIDNLVNGRRENLQEISSDRLRVLVADVRRPADFEAQLHETRVIFHLACLGVRHSIHAPLENHEVNATGTLQLLSAARRAGVERFVYVSSSEVYGTAKSVPIDEEHPTCPTTVYGASKLAGECYTRAFYATYGYPTVIVRPFNAYGPRSHHEGDSGEVIPKFLLRALAGRPMVVFGDGTQTRDFTYVRDTARGIRLAGFADQAIGETMNLGSGKEISIRSLAREVARAVHRPDAPLEHVEARPGDVLRLCADSRRAQRLIGFEARVPLSEGLALLREWYRSSGVPPQTLLERDVVRNWIPADSAS